MLFLANNKTSVVSLSLVWWKSFAPLRSICEVLKKNLGADDGYEFLSGAVGYFIEMPYGFT